MYNNILMATDGSKFAQKAVRHAFKLAKALNSRITIVNVTENLSTHELLQRTKTTSGNPFEAYEKAEAVVAAKILAEVHKQAVKAGIVCTDVHVKDKHPAEGIIETAEKKNCDLIVMASHGRRGVQKILLGSIASEVLARSQIPVLIIK